MERGTVFTDHSYEDGYVSHNTKEGNYGPSLWFICLQCGYEKKFNRFRVPKWIKARMEAVGI